LIRALPATLLLATLALAGCDSHPANLATANLNTAEASEPPAAQSPSEDGRPSFVGFDRNIYPGDAHLNELHQHFAFTGFWLNNAPGETSNTWAGHRPQLLAAGFGFLVLWNGRLDAEIKHAQTRDKLTPTALGRQDAEAAIAAAQREGFPAGTVIFLDQEEGGRLLPEQSDYFFGFTEGIAASPYRAGSYLSGQPADDGPGTNGRRITITTAQDVRATVAAKHLHPVALWVAQDACPPAPGCTIDPKAVAHLHPSDSGTLDAQVWQYVQSPRRPDLTRACSTTYAADGNCYAGSTTDLPIDLNLASSADPSHGR
jgi:hypothetical protein